MAKESPIELSILGMALNLSWNIMIRVIHHMLFAELPREINQLIDDFRRSDFKRDRVQPLQDKFNNVLQARAEFISYCNPEDIYASDYNDNNGIYDPEIAQCLSSVYINLHRSALFMCGDDVIAKALLWRIGLHY